MLKFLELLLIMILINRFYIFITKEKNIKNSGKVISKKPKIIIFPMNNELYFLHSNNYSFQNYNKIICRNISFPKKNEN